MDNIDIFNDSAIILERKVPKKIKSWITILISLLILFVFISFIKFNTYEDYTGLYLNKQVIIYSNQFPLNNKLYIEGKKYTYNIISINDNKVILDIELDNNLKVDNNVLRINLLKDRTTIFNILKKKWKDVFSND